MITTGAMQQGLLGCGDIGLLVAPDPKGGLLDGAREREHERPWQTPADLVAGIHGIQTRRGEFAGLAAR